MRKDIWVPFWAFLYFPEVRAIFDLKNVILLSPQVYTHKEKKKKKKLLNAK